MTICPSHLGWSRVASKQICELNIVGTGLRIVPKVWPGIRYWQVVEGMGPRV